MPIMFKPEVCGVQMHGSADRGCGQSFEVMRMSNMTLRTVTDLRYRLYSLQSTLYTLHRIDHKACYRYSGSPNFTLSFIRRMVLRTESMIP